MPPNFLEPRLAELRPITLVGNWAKKVFRDRASSITIKIAVNSHSGGWTDKRGPVARLTALPAI